MKKIPLSKLILPFALFAITIYDVAIAVKDFLTRHTNSGILILIMAVILGFTGVATLIGYYKKYK
jgi:hypothetical protein